MPDRVLDQCVERETEAIGVDRRGDRVQAPELPAAGCDGLPAQEQLGDDHVDIGGLADQEVGVLGCGDEEQPLAQLLQPLQFAYDDADVLLLAAAQRRRQQLGMTERDRDRGPQLVGRVLQELALYLDEALGFGVDLGLVVGRDPPVRLPGQQDEDGGDHWHLLHRHAHAQVPESVVAGRRDGGRQGDRGQREQPPARPEQEPVQQGQAQPDGVEREDLPGREGDDDHQADDGQQEPGQLGLPEPGRRGC